MIEPNSYALLVPTMQWYSLMDVCAGGCMKYLHSESGSLVHISN